MLMISLSKCRGHPQKLRYNLKIPVWFQHEQITISNQSTWAVAIAWNWVGSPALQWPWGWTAPYWGTTWEVRMAAVDRRARRAARMRRGPPRCASGWTGRLYGTRLPVGTENGNSEITSRYARTHGWSHTLHISVVMWRHNLVTPLLRNFK